MKSNKNMKIYLTSENYKIGYLLDFEAYVVLDRNEERVNNKSYKLAADAINFAELNYKTLC